MRGILVCFTGMDGTGKTTQALVLKRNLEKIGRKCAYMWFRYDMSILATFAVIGVAWIILGRKRPIDREIHRCKPLVNIWLVAGLFDYFLYSVFNILPRLRTGLLICDRYVYDIVAYLMGLQISNSWFSKILPRLLPRPDLTLLLDVAGDVALKRKKEGSINLYSKQRKLYLESLAATSPKAFVLDTRGDFAQTSFEVLKLVKPFVDG
ncbi:dTMP kinase [[Eubacterium] cellulosolvens]